MLARLLVLFCLGLPAQCQTAPPLGAASGFGNAAQPRLLELARTMPALRDTLVWRLAEPVPGAPDWRDPRTRYPRDLPNPLSLALIPMHPLVAHGETVQTDPHVASFAAFARAAADAHPTLTALEIGNEFNGQTFVRGAARELSPKARAALHARHLTAVARAVRPAHPNLQLVGGAAHSVAAGYLWHLADQGGIAQIDQLALHPYTTEPEQFLRQIAILRRHPDLATIPLDISEFGSKNNAPGDLLRYYCQFSLANVARVAWYPLAPRGDGYAALITRDGRTLPAGAAFALVQSLFVGKDVTPLRPDPFTYGCSFDQGRAVVIWGAARPLPLTDPAIKVHAGAPTQLAPHTPVVLSAARPIALGQSLILGDQTVLADSFDQFRYDPPDIGFAVSLDTGNGPLRPRMFPGQDRPGVPWTPYLGHPPSGSWITARGARLGVPLRHSYRAERTQTIEIQSQTEASQPATLHLLHNEKPIQSWPLAARQTHTHQLTLTAGDHLTLVLIPRSPGAHIRFRHTLRRAP